MTVAGREKLQLNPWSITLKGIIIIAHKLKAILKHIFFAAERWLGFLMVRKPRLKTLFFSKLLSFFMPMIFIKPIIQS